MKDELRDPREERGAFSQKAAASALATIAAAANGDAQCLPSDPQLAAKTVGLRYVQAESPGITRKGAGKGFRYLAPHGNTVRDAATLARIAKLAIPPAWTDVWICPNEDGHIQATGRDARGRKQYRYHERWREVRDATKYERMLAFSDALPRIRAQVDKDLSLTGMPREKVLATLVRLLELTRMRIGNEEYAKENSSYGLTTLRNKHVDVHGSTLRFHFKGKSGKEHDIEVHDRRVARIVAKCEDLPGQSLFEYVDETGQVRTVESTDVNDYIRRAAGGDFTAKDFRTWAGTLLAARALRLCGPCEGVTKINRNIVQAIKEVSSKLGNTPAVCKRSYVHPAVLEAYRDGLLAALEDGADDEEEAIVAVLRRAASETDADRLVRRLRASVRGKKPARKAARKPADGASGKSRRRSKKAHPKTR